MAIRNRAIEKWIWVLIYGGMLGFALGLFMRRASGGGEPIVAWVLMAGGVLALIAGAVGIGWRSRRPLDAEPDPEPAVDD